MADKGFNIADLLNARSVTLNIPPKLVDPSGQFSEVDRVKTRRIASVRIHVERAIGRVKTLKFWSLFLIRCIIWPTKFFSCVHCLLTSIQL